jgi:Rrf2 family protein
MSANSRLTIATHALAWMASHERLGGQWTTSEQIAGSVKTNPVVIRRQMAQLVKAGILISGRGPGAGWRLAREASEITLRQIDEAMGAEPVFAMHRNEPSAICPIAQGIRPTLAPVYTRVDEAVRRELERITLADVLDDIVAG